MTALIAAATAAAAADPKPASINGQLVDTYTGLAISEADVFVTGPHGLQATVATDATGHYLASVDGPGTYYLTFSNGASRIGYQVQVGDGGSTHFDAKLDRGEVIEIHDLPHKRPPVMPTGPRRPLIPAYSDDLVETDAWVRAWLLLDIDESGAVARMKFLNRPGHALDQIAVDHALGLKFTPAYDNLGHPTRTLIIIPMEWPSYWWMLTVGGGFALRMPEPLQLARVPCSGTGPMHLGSVHPSYRDCSRPTITKANLDKEPWYARPAAISSR